MTEHGNSEPLIDLGSRQALQIRHEVTGHVNDCSSKIRSGKTQKVLPRVSKFDLKTEARHRSRWNTRHSTRRDQIVAPFHRGKIDPWYDAGFSNGRRLECSTQTTVPEKELFLILANSESLLWDTAQRQVVYDRSLTERWRRKVQADLVDEEGVRKCTGKLEESSKLKTMYLMVQLAKGSVSKVI